MSFTSLPDLCVLAIFDKLTVLDFLGVDLVCPRWASLQPTAALRRKSLTLEVKGVATQMTEKTTQQFYHQENIKVSSPCHREDVKLSVGRLTPAVVDRLVSKLPHITSLVILMDTIRPKQIDQIIAILTAYQEKLTSLRFFSHMTVPFAQHFKCIDFLEPPGNMISLIDAINSLNNLKELTFENTSSMPSSSGAPQIDMSILGKLNQFELSTGHNVTLLYRSLFTVGEANSQLKKISITNLMDVDSLSIFLRFTNAPEKYSHLAVKLDDTFVELEEPNWDTFVNLFGQTLSSLELQLTNKQPNRASFDRLDLILSSLSTFDNLTHLSLAIELPQYSKLFSWSVNRWEPISSSLNSVRSLKMTLTSYSHSQLYSWVDFSSTFPNVVEVQFIVVNRDCYACGYGQVNKGQDPGDETVKACLRALVAPAKQCGNLKKLVAVNRFSKCITHTEEM